MLPVYLFSNNAESLKQYSDIVSRYIDRSHTEEIKIVCQTGSPFELLDRLETNPQQSVYLLNLYSDAPMNGVELTHEIRKYDPRGYVVMITGHPEYLTFRDHTELMDCVEDVAPDMESALIECIDNARILYHRTISPYQPQKVRLVIRDIYLPFPLKVVRYITTVHGKSHVIEIHADDEVFQYRGILDDILTGLEYTFRKCHRAYIVNLRYVTGIDRKKMVLKFDNGDTVPVSHRAAKEIEQFLYLLNI